MIQPSRFATHATRLLMCSLAAFALSGAASQARARDIPTYTYEVVHAYPHDINAFTEGLFYKDGFLYESTGLVGRSSVRKVRLETGEVLSSADLPPEIFGEGLTYWNDRLIAVTWKSQVGFLLNLKSLSPEGQFAYRGEGWGLARSDREIIMSDGSAVLRFLDPRTLREVHKLRVTAGGMPVDQLNELEWVDGEIFSNIWRTDLIARIDPTNGRVVGWIDLTGLLPEPDRVPGHTDVLNGIAYDKSTKRLFVTGKLWPKLFEIRLVRRPDGPAR